MSGEAEGIMGYKREREAGAVVHAQARSGLTSHRVLFCNGRAVSGMVGTTAEVTCKSCRKALASVTFLAEAGGEA